MGINDLFKELPGGDIKTSVRVGFDKIALLLERLVDIDNGTLIYTCALRHHNAYNAVDYLPAAPKFQFLFSRLTPIIHLGRQYVAYPYLQREHQVLLFHEG